MEDRQLLVLQEASKLFSEHFAGKELDSSNKSLRNTKLYLTLLNPFIQHHQWCVMHIENFFYISTVSIWKKFAESSGSGLPYGSLKWKLYMEKLFKAAYQLHIEKKVCHPE